MDPFTVIAVLTKTYIIGSETSALVSSIPTSVSSHHNLEATSGSNEVSSVYHSGISSSTSLATSQALATKSISNSFHVITGTSIVPKVNDVKSTSSTNVGLAIGIPIAVLSIVILGAFGWYFFKKKQFAKIRKENLPFTDKNWNLKLYNWKKLDDATLTETRPLPPLPSSVYSSPSTTQENLKPSVNEKPKVDNNSWRKSFINLFSTAEIKQLTPNTPKGFSLVLSPMFLKKFHLSGPSKRNKEDEENMPSPKPKSYHIPPVVMKNKDTTGDNSYNSLHDFENVVESQVPQVKKITISKVGDSTKWEVVRPYKKLFDYELSVEIGDIVEILEFHSDGWCLARNKEGNSGLIPRLCVLHKSYSKN